MKTYTVQSTTEFKNILRQVEAGDTIALAPGDYSGIQIIGFNGGTGVNITSADAKNPAILGDLLVRDSIGLNFSDLKFVAEPGRFYHYTTIESDRISFDRIEVSGPEDLALPDNDLSAFMLRNSTNVSVTNSEFHHLWHGINALNNTGVNISNNYFHDLRTDGYRGGGNSDILVAENIFTDFKPAEGDHPDAIQFWTAQVDEVARDITIRDNLFFRGDGDYAQGIFIRDDNDTLPYENVTITGNVILGGMYNGIAIDGVNGGIISNNTVIGFEDMVSRIRANMDQNLDVSGNVASAYVFDNPEDARFGQNQTVELSDVSINGLISQWVLDNIEAAAIWNNVFSDIPDTPLASYGDDLFAKVAYDPEVNGQKVGGSAAEKTEVAGRDIADDGFIDVAALAATGNTIAAPGFEALPAIGVTSDIVAVSGATSSVAARETLPFVHESMDMAFQTTVFDDVFASNMQHGQDFFL